MPLLRGDTDFPILDIKESRDWLLLPAATDDFLLVRDLNKLRSALGSTCRSILIEKRYFCKDYRDTYANFYAKKYATYPDKAVRLLFFGREIEPSKWWDVSQYSDSFLGYSVIRPTRVTSLGRTVLSPKACTSVTGFMCLTGFEVNLIGYQLRVDGFPYISQDSDVTICAHAACWMCFRYLSERYADRPEAYPFEISQLTQDVSAGRLVPSNGLSMSQVSEIFAHYGLSPEIYFRESTGRDQFYRLLYAYIESGMPVVVGLNDPEHAVTAIGHTSRFGPTKRKGLTWSSHYVTGLVVNDDNQMPYQVIRKPGVKVTGHVSSQFTLRQIDSFVVPLHESVHLAAEDVEDRTLRLLDDPDIGLSVMAPSLSKGDLVVRQFLTTSRAYKDERRKDVEGNQLPYGLALIYAILPMPKFIWVTELSTKTLYTNGPRIVGEILWDATASQYDRYAYLTIHYPEMMIVNNRDSMANDLSRLRFRKLPGLVDYGPYRHNLQEV